MKFEYRLDNQIFLKIEVWDKQKKEYVGYIKKTGVFQAQAYTPLTPSELSEILHVCINVNQYFETLKNENNG